MDQGLPNWLSVRAGSNRERIKLIDQNEVNHLRRINYGSTGSVPVKFKSKIDRLSKVIKKMDKEFEIKHDTQWNKFDI